MPVRNFRIEIGSTFASHLISGVPGLDDQRRLSWQGGSLDLRYRFLDRETALFGLTFATEAHAHRVDETTAEAVRSFGTEFRLAFDRELVPNRVIAAFNLIYEPEWTRLVGSGVMERESTAGAALGLMAQLRPGFLLGGEARYLRKYEGTGAGGTCRAGVVCRSNGVLPIVETLAADRKLERSGVGASGGVNCQP